jgi:small subunit ribosomal protein S2
MTEEKEIVEIPEDSLKEKELEKAAEAESIETEVKVVPEDVPSNTEVKIKKKELSKADKLKALKEKAAKLMTEKVDKLDTKALKEEVKASRKKGDMLIDLEEYVKTGIYLGTRVVTPDMKPFVYRRRADGLAIFNTDLIDEKLKKAIKYLSKFNPEDVILVCKRQSGWKAAKLFNQATGIRIFTKKYPAGIMTNTKLEDFFEVELTIVTDGWLDKNALKDTLDVKKEVLMICGTNNFSKGANQVIIGNNKSGKSIGIIYYLLAKGYLKERGKDNSKLGDMELWINESDE